MCQVVHLSDNMTVTITPTGKHGWQEVQYNRNHGLYSISVPFKVENGLVGLFTNINVNIGRLRLNQSFNKYTRNFKFYVETHVF